MPSTPPPTSPEGLDPARLLATLTRACQEHGTEAGLEDVLEHLRRQCGADVALVLRRADPVTAEALATSPPGVLPDGVTTASIFADALEHRRTVVRGASEPATAIPAVLRGTTIIEPWPRPCGMEGALVLVRKGPEPFGPDVRRYLHEVLGLLCVLARLHETSRQAETTQGRFDAIVQTLPHGLLFLDQGGIEAWANGAAAALVGVPPGSVAPHQAARAMASLRGRAENREQIARHDAKLLADPEVELRDIRWCFAGPPRRVLSVSSTPTRTRHARGRLWLFIDVTAQHLAQEEIEASHAALARALDRAEQANEAKSNFLATMTHELRTPMNGIMGMAGLLLDTHLPASQHSLVETIRNSGDTLLTTINDILDFSKIEAGMMELERQPFLLRRCVEEAVDLVMVQAAHKQLELGVLIAADVPASIHGDVTRLRQVLVNLLGNAVKFTDAGEVVVEVTRAGPEHGDGDGEAPCWHIEVRDTGIGIPAERQDRLFRSFSQAHSSTSRTHGGTGLGLAICKRLVELMGGRIWFESTLGKGTTFHVVVPAPVVTSPRGTDTQPSREVPRRMASLAGLRVLVVDDSDTTLRMLSMQLQTWRMKPLRARSGEEALATLRRERSIALLLVDHQMPQMDGMTLASAIRREAGHENLPILMLVSAADPKVRIEAARVSNGSVIKPVKQSDLLDAIMSALYPESRRVVSPRLSTIDPTMAERRPLRILLAEDNVINQKVALMMLGRLGYRADVAANGLEVLEAIRLRDYDVILMDSHMPEMSGLEAVERLGEQLPKTARPRIIATTANATPEARRECFDAGMDDFIPKPIQVPELVAALERASRSGAPPRPG